MAGDLLQVQGDGYEERQDDRTPIVVKEDNITSLYPAYRRRCDRCDGVNSFAVNGFVASLTVLLVSDCSSHYGLRVNVKEHHFSV